MKCNRFELEKISSELYQNKEIGYYDYDFKGLYIEEKGVASYSNKKYYSLFINWITDSIKLGVQIFIPVLSLLIAYMALSLKLKNTNIENERRIIHLENKLKYFEKQVKELDARLEASQNPIKLNSIRKDKTTGRFN
ncbi:hypothetical protein [Aquimarina mytili]|uniref:Uncharacterized protein n=1 Tax=Aquimarina mytili TaxID=874423 RepID=A0A936ZTY1_9FLAO|nr:hypothetical protein [Aquimarina mytili]MBL0685352.1 hypothetical protein [Aquimarina mytili]